MSESIIVPVFLELWKKNSQKPGQGLQIAKKRGEMAGTIKRKLEKPGLVSYAS
jgi:hypothetical protein